MRVINKMNLYYYKFHKNQLKIKKWKPKFMKKLNLSKVVPKKKSKKNVNKSLKLFLLMQIPSQNFRKNKVLSQILKSNI